MQKRFSFFTKELLINNVSQWTCIKQCTAYCVAVRIHTLLIKSLILIIGDLTNT